MKQHSVYFRVAQAFAAMALITSFASAPCAAAPLGEERAKEIMQDSKCSKCHGIDKAKDGPSYKKIAAKFREPKHSAGALQAVINQITQGKKVKFEDGHEEEHKIIKTEGEGETRAFAEFILALPD